MFGKLNLSENLFIGVQELSALQNFALGYKALFGLLASNFGLIEDKDSIRLEDTSNSDRNSFKATSPGNLQLQFFSPSYAIAYPNNIICWDKNRVITLPDSYKNNNYYVKISYANDSLEEGTLKFDTNGNVTGTGTKFVEKLRGEPNFSSKIQLFTFNGISFDDKGYYFVESVNSDTNIKIYSETGTIGDNSLVYYYKVVGTFPLGSNITEDEIYPFVYDNCKVEFIKETTLGEVPNSYAMKLDNTSFYVARISIDSNGIVSIQDKRYLWESEGEKYKKWFSLK